MMIGSTRWLAPVLLLCILLGGCTAPRVSSGARSTPASGDTSDPSTPGPYAVGATNRSFSRILPTGLTRAVETVIWYPAVADPDKLNSNTRAGINAKPIAGQQPLIVFSHGSGGSPDVSSSFLIHLASHGFVVAGIYHRDCTAACPAGETAAQNMRRPADVVSVTDGILAMSIGDDTILRGLINPAQIGVAGWSYGG